jgi:hypothetical protein
MEYGMGAGYGMGEGQPKIRICNADLNRTSIFLAKENY